MGQKRPLANLFALGSSRQDVLAAAERALGSDGRWQSWRPHPGWLFASSPLGDSEPDPVPVRASGLAFAEGRDAMLGAPETQAGSAEKLLLELAREQPDLARWPGDFTLLGVNAGGTVTAVRSCAGLVPLYAWEASDRVAIATQCGSLIRYAGWRGRLDPLISALWAMALPSNPANRSHLSGVRTLGAGEMLRIRSDGTRLRSLPISSYWSPQPAELERGSQTEVVDRQRQLRALLLQRLEADLDPRGGNLLSLSGGVDSSALLALSARVLGRPVMTWSQVPPRGAATRERELGYIAPLRQWAGVTRFWETELTAANEEALIAQAPAIPFPVLHQALCSLPAIHREAPVKVLVGGEFADEICGARVTTPDWATGTSLVDLLAHPRQWPFGASALPRWFKVRLLYAVRRPYPAHPGSLMECCPGLLQEAYRELLAELRRRTRSLPVLGQHLMTRHRSIDFAAMNWEGCSALGIRRSIPFLSRETIELSLSCHPSELIGPDTKRLLRGALHDDVPRENLYRPDKGSFGLKVASELRPIADLKLDDDAFWDELADVVSPAWRRVAVQRGSLTYTEKYPLLYLMKLQRDLKTALKSATATAPPPA